MPSRSVPFGVKPRTWSATSSPRKPSMGSPASNPYAPTPRACWIPAANTGVSKTVSTTFATSPLMKIARASAVAQAPRSWPPFAISPYRFSASPELATSPQHFAAVLVRAIPSSFASSGCDFDVAVLGLRLGASFLNQREGETDFRVGGAEVEQKLFRKGTLKAEVPVSSGELPLGVDYSLGTSTGQCCQPARTHNGAAVRAELSQPLGAGDTVLHGRFAGTDQGFLNPYGLTTVPGQRSGGFSVDTRPSRSTQLSLGFDAERNHNDFVDNRRNTFTAKLVKRIGESLAAKAGFDSRQFEDFKSIRRIDSNLIGAGLEWKPVPRLEASLRREQNLGEADPTYP